MPDPTPTDHSSVMSFPDREFSAISDRQARRLLKLGMIQPPRPVDPLIDRLHEGDGREWFLGLLNREPFVGLCGPNAEMLRAGVAPLAALISLKESGKSLARDPDRNNRLIARAAYDLAIAAAIVHHRRIITTQKRRDLVDVLGDLAEATPSPWREFLQRAADTVPEIA